MNPPLTNKHNMLPDTGTTGNYIVMSMPLLDNHSMINDLIVALPNSNTVSAMCAGFLKLPNL